MASPVSSLKERVVTLVVSADLALPDDDLESPISPVGLAQMIMEVSLSRVWLGGLASRELQMPSSLDSSVRAGDEHVIEAAGPCQGKPVRLGQKGDGIQKSGGSATMPRYYDPRRRVQVALLDLRLEEFYWVGETIGRGGFARVRLAQHLKSGQATVVKVIQKKNAGHSYKEFVVDAGIYEMFLRKKDHTNVVRYFDLLESPDHYLVVMERLEGLPLESALTVSGGKWSQRCCAAAMTDLLSALCHMHTVIGFYHRDVKIENLQYRSKTTLIDEHMECFGDLVIFDFGLARFVHQEWDRGYAGTALYVAPEVLTEFNTKDSRKSKTGGYSPAVDLWAAGLLLFAFLAGDFPYDEDDIWGCGDESGDVFSGFVKQAIQELGDRLTKEGSPVPRELLDGLLQADPTRRLDASAALQDPWLTRAKPPTVILHPPTPAMKKNKAPTNDVRYYNGATTKSAASKENKVPTNDYQFRAAAEYLAKLPDPALEDDYDTAATNDNAAPYYGAAVMKSTNSKETKAKAGGHSMAPMNEAKFRVAAEYLESLTNQQVAKAN
jgi:calcium/calmodulin-dependent protein kinase I